MSFIPGNVNEKTILTDGAQIDHLSENTVGHGVRVQGITNPTTYPVLAGDIGETVLQSGSGTVAVVNGTWKTITSRTLQAGTWLVFGRGWLNNGATPPSSMTMMAAGLSTAIDGAPSQFDVTYPLATSNYWNSINIFPLVVTISSATTYYLNMNLWFSAANNGAYDGASSKILAIRIA